MARVSERKFPLNAKDYELYEEVGDGVSATVYRALCIPLKEIVAIKVLDLEKCNNDLDGIRREVQTMSLIDHPNLLRGHCSFTADHCLWLVMPYMAGGSCLHIMKSSFQEGFEEPVIATLLRETLRALVYLHAQGHIHRDVKAGNILIDSNGTIKLADFGVSACMFDSGDRQRSRNTFVGTPCWMAPEVMQQLHGYNFKADIWSFGITALELAHGHAPFSKYPPMKVLLMTLQNAPPGLDYERDKRFSKSFKDLVATCLVKDPKKRPTSEKLLKHNFFKQARSPDYLARSILEGLPPLGERYRTLKAKEADLLMQNKAEYENKDQLSQQEYVRGISAWNFNLEDLKSQAALIPDYECVSPVEDPDSKQNDRLDDIGFSPERASSSATAPSQEDGLNDIHDLESSLASFPIKLQALRGCFDVGEDDDDAITPNWEHIGQLDSAQPLLTKRSIGSLSQNAVRDEDENTGQSNSLSNQVVPAQRKFLSGSLIPDTAFSPKKIITDTDRDFQQPKDPAERNYSGQLYRTRRDTVEDPSEGQLVQCKGRFKVTSTDVSPKGPAISAFSPFCGGSSSPTSLNLSAVSILSSLQMYLQQNAMQREDAVKLIKIVEQTCAKQSEPSEGSIDELLQMTPASTREKELQSQVNQLYQDVSTLSEELRKQKERNLQLEKQLNAAASNKEERKV